MWLLRFGRLRTMRASASDEASQCKFMEITMRPPATLNAKNPMKIHTPKRFQNSRRARADRVW